MKTLQGSTPIVNLRYDRHLNGQTSAITSDTGTGSFDTARGWTYAYDGLNRLELR